MKSQLRKIQIQRLSLSLKWDFKNSLWNFSYLKLHTLNLLTIVYHLYKVIVKNCIQKKCERIPTLVYLKKNTPHTPYYQMGNPHEKKYPTYPTKMKWVTHITHIPHILAALDIYLVKLLFLVLGVSFYQHHLKSEYLN